MFGNRGLTIPYCCTRLSGDLRFDIRSTANDSADPVDAPPIDAQQAVQLAISGTS
ncbi:hypothetical protein GcC1_100034 [Golovinomyces cichoracearum]|uniref:Uncharacterized protein n=1 Tax=Golovinomyces cichoracearum TaxID=62708 RepID=A0A420IAB0_9PEZI|nr:hypothetical protein GcC1_100034 [Golovinomyces cichoracearum]